MIYLLRNMRKLSRTLRKTLRGEMIRSTRWSRCLTRGCVLKKTCRTSLSKKHVMYRDNMNTILNQKMNHLTRNLEKNKPSLFLYSKSLHQWEKKETPSMKRNIKSRKLLTKRNPLSSSCRLNYNEQRKKCYAGSRSLSRWRRACLNMNRNQLIWLISSQFSRTRWWSLTLMLAWAGSTAQWRLEQLKIWLAQ